MKVRDLLHDDTPGWQKADPTIKYLITIIHELQTKVEILMGNVQSNTTARNTGKYITPAGRFKTYASAASANNLSTYMVKKLIKDEDNLDYYIDLDNPTAITI